MMMVVSVMCLDCRETAHFLWLNKLFSYYGCLTLVIVNQLDITVQKHLDILFLPLKYISRKKRLG